MSECKTCVNYEDEPTNRYCLNCIHRIPLQDNYKRKPREYYVNIYTDETIGMFKSTRKECKDLGTGEFRTIVVREVIDD